MFFKSNFLWGYFLQKRENFKSAPNGQYRCWSCSKNAYKTFLSQFCVNFEIKVAEFSRYGPYKVKIWLFYRWKFGPCGKNQKFRKPVFFDQPCSGSFLEPKLSVESVFKGGKTKMHPMARKLTFKNFGVDFAKHFSVKMPKTKSGPKMQYRC